MRRKGRVMKANIKELKRWCEKHDWFFIGADESNGGITTYYYLSPAGIAMSFDVNETTGEVESNE